MRRRMNGLALQVQEELKRGPHAGELFVIPGERGNLIKFLWHDGLGDVTLRHKIIASPADGAVGISCQRRLAQRR